MSATDAKPQILVPSTPKHLELTQTQIEDFICDPPLAAYVIFGEVMDEFQKQRLIDYCWVPRVMDSSGFSSFKTRTFFIAFNLRCILIPDHVAAVFYQTFENSQKNFYAYYDHFLRRSPIFRAQIGRMNLDMTETEGKGLNKGPSCWNVYFKNSSHLMLPAPSFLTESRNQAGKRFNDLGLDEFTKSEASGGSTGIDDQLIGRCTRESYCQDHPWHCNHILFLATAEDTLHPSYSRYKEFCREVKKGNPDYSAFSYSFKDISDFPMSDGKPFRVGLRINKVLHDMRERWRNTPAKWLKEGLGIWSKVGRGWYDGDSIERCVELGKSRGLQPMLGRRDDPEDNERILYFLGVDIAKADRKKSDDGALVTLRAKLLPEFKEFSTEIGHYELSFVHAYKVRRADISQWSGLVHLLNKRFSYSGICADHGGGGNWLRPELAKAKQVINDIPTEVIPITTPDDSSVVVANPILIMFTNGDDSIMQTWDHIKGADMLKDVAHTLLTEAIDRNLIAFPQAFNDLPKSVTESWSLEKQWASRLLHLARCQLLGISVAVDNEDKYVTTRNGAKVFASRAKDDFAYAALHSFVRFLVWLKAGDRGLEQALEDQPMGE